MVPCILAEVQFHDMETVYEELGRSRDSLQINTGTYFKHTGKLIASRDQIFMTIRVPMVDFNNLLTLLGEDRFSSLESDCTLLGDFAFNKQEFLQANDVDAQKFITMSACHVYEMVQREIISALYKTRLVAANRLEVLLDYIPELDEIIMDKFPDLFEHMSPQGRHKRLVGVLVTGLSVAMSAVRTGLGAYRTYKLEKRLKIMDKLSSLLLKRTHMNSGAILDLKNSYSAYAISNNNEISVLHKGLESTSRDLSNLTLEVAGNLLRIFFTEWQ